MTPDLNKIPLAGLCALITEKIGMPVELEVIIAQNSAGEPVLSIASQELKEHTGVMQCIYNSLKVQNFGGGLSRDNKFYWMVIDFRYDYKIGGSNGVTIFDALYDFTSQTWRIRY